MPGMTPIKTVDNNCIIKQYLLQLVCNVTFMVCNNDDPATLEGAGMSHRKTAIPTNG